MKFPLPDNIRDKIAEGIYALDRDVFAIAEEFGCSVVFPEDNEVQLDIDTQEQRDFVYERIRELKEWEKIIVSQTESKKGHPHYHICIKFPNHKFTPMERIGIQAVMGSDCVREWLNTLRYINGDSQPSCLFERR